jgi:endonuclease YncB( thermonuclease family)
MKKILLALLLLATPAMANPYDYRVFRVIDGDTVQFDAPFLPEELGKSLSLRILGVDTPEKGFRAKCEQEAALAERASEFTKYVVFTAKKHQIIIKKWDKFGGRVLGDLLLDGKSLRELLIENNYAVPYNGAKKPNWCE